MLESGTGMEDFVAAPDAAVTHPGMPFGFCNLSTEGLVQHNVGFFTNYKK